MNLVISNKDSFLNNFLIPLSKVVDSAVLKVEKTKITSLISTNDNTIVVNAVYNDDEIEYTGILNVPDIKKFCRIVACIEESSITFKVDANNISYTSPTIRFKYHLYEDNIISVPKLDMEKLKRLSFDAKFSLQIQAISALIKGSTIATDTNKIYLTVKGSDVYGDLTDQSRANTDSYGMRLTEDYSGTAFSKPIPLNFEIFRIISYMKFKTIDIQLVTKMGVMVFDIALDSSNIKFVVSALEN
jgi:hypothetical protein